MASPVQSGDCAGRRVIINAEEFSVDAEEGNCKSGNPIEDFKCNVEILAEFSRITIFLPEIVGIDEIFIGALVTDAPGGLSWISVERREFALWKICTSYAA
ncbi:unnamed protein product [Dibothriocephalus latus]|uniref:Uncharacterized protein n=1 Tax=Dibothriocephalus latus TaxID=60516 RepID=A0A3P7MG81_DIBLA|nr:unnamed protein product [Dibothriocephalus latus]